MIARLAALRVRPGAWWSSRPWLVRDGWLYAASAVFAVVLGLTSNQHAQWQWGYLSAGTYGAAALAAVVVARRHLRRVHLVRVVLVALVVLGAVALPLALEVRWRQAQPEVGVIARAGEFLSKGQDPYQTYDQHGRLVHEEPGVPAWESFFPYFPLMGVFGLPSADRHESKGLTDARLVMTLMTMLASGLALALLRLKREKKLLVAQVLVALPSGALFLATGGDDMPILALMLLGVALLQRRRSSLAGISLGLAAAMKLTAWPMALGALLVARDRDGRSTWVRVFAWSAAIVLATTVPFIVRAPAAFMANVFAFPLGFAGVTSPAASALPGHLLTTAFPVLGHVLAPVAFLVGGYFAARYAREHWPLELSQVLGLLAAAFVVLIAAASATRVGYVIYPLNFLVWSSVTREVRVEEPELVFA